MDKTSKDPNTVFDNFYDGLKNYRNQETVGGLGSYRNESKEFWQHGDKDI
jgi:hypothetical protein